MQYIPDFIKDHPKLVAISSIIVALSCFILVALSCFILAPFLPTGGLITLVLSGGCFIGLGTCPSTYCLYRKKKAKRRLVRGGLTLQAFHKEYRIAHGQSAKPLEKAVDEILAAKEKNNELLDIIIAHRALLRESKEGVIQRLMKQGEVQKKQHYSFLEKQYDQQLVDIQEEITSHRSIIPGLPPAVLWKLEEKRDAIEACNMRLWLALSEWIKSATLLTKINYEFSEKWDRQHPHLVNRQRHQNFRHSSEMQSPPHYRATDPIENQSLLENSSNTQMSPTHNLV